MARLVLGVGTAHTPQLNIPPREWQTLYDKDRTDDRIDYPGLLKAADPALQNEASPERWEERYAACHKAIGVLRQVLEDAKPDVIVVIGDDQHEQFLSDNMPMFSIFYGPEVTVHRRPFDKLADWQQISEMGLPEKPTRYPASPKLATHLIASLAREGFDISSSNQQKAGVPLGHAFSFVYRYLTPAGTVPLVPFAVNCFFPPNQPTPKRCFALGRAIRDTIEKWEGGERVVLLASGGLSHTIIEEHLDRSLLDALKNKDAARLCAFPERAAAPGTSEFRNWVALAGATETMKMELVDYVTAYRSPAGTGCAMAFAYWH